MSPLLRELIRAFGTLPVDYDEQGADGRLAAVILDQLRAAPELGYSLPWPDDVRLRGICEALYEQPDLSLQLAQWSEQLHISEDPDPPVPARHRPQLRAWRQRLRLLSALPLLERGQPVTDVALACGYDSTSAFIAAFGQQFGYAGCAGVAAPVSEQLLVARAVQLRSPSNCTGTIDFPCGCNGRWPRAILSAHNPHPLAGKERAHGPLADPSISGHPP